MRKHQDHKLFTRITYSLQSEQLVKIQRSDSALRTNQERVKRKLCLWCFSKLSCCHWKNGQPVCTCSYWWGQAKERKREFLPIFKWCFSEVTSWLTSLKHGQFCRNCFFKNTWKQQSHYLWFSRWKKEEVIARKQGVRGRKEGELQEVCILTLPWLTSTIPFSTAYLHIQKSLKAPLAKNKTLQQQVCSLIWKA